MPKLSTNAGAPVFLVGPPGSGKTSCGKVLCDLSSVPFFDTDQLIESQIGMTVAQIFSTHGEERFRSLESGLLDSLQDRGETIIYATGGGLPVFNDNMAKLLSLGVVICLYADLDVLLERVKKSKGRPLLTANDDNFLRQSLSKIIESRMSVYIQARYKIDTTHLTPHQAAHEIMRLLGWQPSRNDSSSGGL